MLPIMLWFEKHKIKLAVIIILFGLCLPLTAPAKALRTTTVNVIGTGRVCDKNISKSREQAIADSLVSALESVLSEIISRDLLIHNFQKLNEIFYRHTDRYITDYKVFAEVSSGNRYRVMVQATISVDKVEKRLVEEGILLGKTPLPEILFLVTEQNINDPIPKYWWGRGMLFFESTVEKAMAATMADKGFHVIDHGVRMPSLDGDYPMNLSDIEAVNMGILLNADIVVIGNAVADKAINRMGSNIRSFKGMINARILRTDTGAEIAATQKAAAAVDSNETQGAEKALSHAGQLAAKELSAQIIAALQDKKEAEMLEILVQGTDDLSNFVMFRKTLETIPGVKNVQTKLMRPGETTIVVLFQGSARELADALMLKTFVMFGISIDKVSENYLKLELIPG
ncbi:MAG: hypothetical protein JJV92_05000 [Desulfosarcina sp.]|nr:hypothetical protein [Desulfobacterales bacterium]